MQLEVANYILMISCKRSNEIRCPYSEGVFRKITNTFLQEPTFSNVSGGIAEDQPSLRSCSPHRRFPSSILSAVLLQICQFVKQDAGKLRNKVLLNLSRSGTGRGLQRHNYPIYTRVIYVPWQRRNGMATADIGNSGFITNGKLEWRKETESEQNIMNRTVLYLSRGL